MGPALVPAVITVARAAIGPVRRPRPAAAGGRATTPPARAPRSVTTRGGAPAGAGRAPRPVAVRKRSAESAAVRAAAASVVTPAECSRGRRCGQKRTQRDDGQLLHFLPPFALPAVAAVGAGGFNATCTASARGLNTKFPSAGWIIKCQTA